MKKVKAYQCSFCGKLYKHNLTKHEIYCKQNPNNFHKCFEYCKYLVREKVIVGYSDCDEYPIYKTEFTCTKKDIKLYSYLAEKRGIDVSELQRMPLECDLHEYVFFDEPVK